jgi:hypothetical protein
MEIGVKIRNIMEGYHANEAASSKNQKYKYKKEYYKEVLQGLLRRGESTLQSM